jgi:hypothetical protein
VITTEDPSILPPQPANDPPTSLPPPPLPPAEAPLVIGPRPAYESSNAADTSGGGSIHYHVHVAEPSQLKDIESQFGGTQQQPLVADRPRPQMYRQPQVADRPLPQLYGQPQVADRPLPQLYRQPKQPPLPALISSPQQKWHIQKKGLLPPVGVKRRKINPRNKYKDTKP